MRGKLEGGWPSARRQWELGAALMTSEVWNGDPHAILEVVIREHRRVDLTLATGGALGVGAWQARQERGGSALRVDHVHRRGSGGACPLSQQGADPAVELQHRVVSQEVDSLPGRRPCELEYGRLGTAGGIRSIDKARLVYAVGLAVGWIWVSGVDRISHRVGVVEVGAVKCDR